MEFTLSCFGSNVKAVCEGDAGIIQSHIGDMRSLLHTASMTQKTKGINIFRLGPVLYSDGTTIEVFLSGSFAWITIVAPNGEINKVTVYQYEGFLFHPRSFDGKGWTPNGDELPNGPYTYPLIDNDHGTRGLKWKAEKWGYVNSPPENYGNIDWKGSKGKILTWKGPQGRTLSFNSIVEVPGYTVLDETMSVMEMDITYYTPFGPNIYRYGKIYDTLPTVGSTVPKVLGAAISPAGKLVAFVSNNYRDVANPAGGTGDFYDEIWVKDGEWSRLWYVVGGRPYYCVFFNQSGTKATRGANEYSIDYESKAVSVVEHAAGSGTMVVTSNISGDKTTTHSGEWRVWSDYKGDERVTGRIRITGGDTASGVNGETAIKSQTPVYALGDGILHITVTISGNQANVSTTGVSCPCEGVWSISSGTITQDGGIDLDSGCGTATVTYTCGEFSGSADVRMNTGVWQNGTLTSYGDGAYGTGTLYQEIVGVTRLNEWAFGGCGVNMGATQDWSLDTYTGCVGGNCAYPGIPINTYYCNISHGYPTPTLPDMSASCTPDSRCAYNCQEPHDVIYWDEAIPNCWYMTHSRVDTWVCE